MNKAYIEKTQRKQNKKKDEAKLKILSFIEK